MLAFEAGVVCLELVDLFPDQTVCVLDVQPILCCVQNKLMFKHLVSSPTQIME
jgi:hypothetical protein